jgi:hypothetical protein
VTGNELNFYLSENNKTPDTIDFAAGADVTFSAATTGDLAGILFFGDRNTTGNLVHNLTGGSTMDLDGISYFPAQDVQFSGGTNLDATSSLLIADTVTFTGNSEVGDFQGSATQSNNNLIAAILVE